MPTLVSLPEFPDFRHFSGLDPFLVVGSQSVGPFFLFCPCNSMGLASSHCRSLSTQDPALPFHEICGGFCVMRDPPQNGVHGWPCFTGHACEPFFAAKGTHMTSLVLPKMFSDFQRFDVIHFTGVFCFEGTCFILLF